MAKVQLGDPLKIRAADWNKMLDVADLARSREIVYTAGSGGFPTQRGVIVPVKNNTGAVVARYHAAAIGAPVVPPGDNEQEFLNRFAFVGEDMSASYFGRFAVFQETTDVNRMGLAMIEGVTVAEITVNNIDHNRVDVDTAGGSKLVSQYYGSGEILYKETGTGTKLAIIRIGSFVAPQLKAVAEEDIAAGGSGDVYIQRNATATELVTAHLNWMAGSTGVSNGDELLIHFFPDENKWGIDGAQC